MGGKRKRGGGERKRGWGRNRRAGGKRGRKGKAGEEREGFILWDKKWSKNAIRIPSHTKILYEMLLEIRGIRLHQVCF